MTPASATIVDHPRAGTREQLSLDGEWNFRLDGHGDWRTAVVPGPWQAQFNDLRTATGTATYAREFELPEAWRGREVALRFGAVSYFAEVFLNGGRLGTHEGGYLPFAFVLPADLPARSRVEVRATLPSGDARAYSDFPFAEIPHGKQSWYGPLGGIWQSVTLEGRDRRHIAGCRLRAELATGHLTLDVDVAEEAEAVALVVRDPDGAEVASAEAPVARGRAALTLTIPEVRAWSPESPALYRAELFLLTAGETVDTHEESFGFRSFEARDGQLLPERRAALPAGGARPGLLPRRHLHAAVDRVPRGPAPEGQGAGAQHAALPHQGAGPALLRGRRPARDAGLDRNPECRRPSASARRPAAAARRWRASSRRDGNHPSIVAWTIINEDWGTRLRENRRAPPLARRNLRLAEGRRPGAARRRQLAVRRRTST